MLGLGQGTCKGPEARKTVHSRDLGVSASAPECTRLFVSTQPVLTWREDSLSPRAAARALREQEELVWDQLVQAEALRVRRRREGQGCLRGKEGTVPSLMGRRCRRGRKGNTVMPILNNAFNFQPGSYNVFLVVFAHSCLGCSVALGPVQRLFCLFIFLFFRKRGKGREKETERNVGVGGTHRLAASRTPPTGDPALQPRHKPCWGIELVTFWFSGQCSIH